MSMLFTFHHPINPAKRTLTPGLTPHFLSMTSVVQFPPRQMMDGWNFNHWPWISISCHDAVHEGGQNTDPRSAQDGDVMSSRGSRPTQTDICSTLPINTEGYTELPAERADSMLQINTHSDLLGNKWFICKCNVWIWIWSGIRLGVGGKNENKLCIRKATALQEEYKERGILYC